jgi:MarR family transcriptional regulator, temperature-dependent positive regulator of motility
MLTRLPRSRHAVHEKPSLRHFSTPSIEVAARVFLLFANFSMGVAGVAFLGSLRCIIFHIPNRSKWRRVLATTLKARLAWQPSGEESVGFILIHSAHGWIRCLEQKLRPMRLTHLQFSLMAAIAVLQKKKTIPHQGYLAVFTGFDKVMVSKSLALLLKRKLVKKSDHPSVPRGKRIDLTREGYAALDRARPLYDEAVAQYYGALTEAELTTLGAVLHKLLESQDLG